ncbi:hypothetical protein F5B20DRAFT_546756 [Whalleya microplaca]|nr:hypothetical protein F5B20DRAFT_546756 [Whalleya microplaca]
MATLPPGLLLLRAAPLLASTSYVTFTVAEDIYLRPWGSFRPDLRAPANAVIPAFMDRWQPPGLAMIFVLYPAGIATAIANLVSKQHGIPALGCRSRVAGYLYAAGAVFGALHFAFGPWDLAILARIGEGEEEREGDNGGAMADWSRMNVVRGLCADFPSWVCYFAGFMLAMT